MLNFILGTFFILISLEVFSEETVDSKNIKIIFGSCSNQNISMPHWKHISSYKPEYLFLLGDNVYGDFNNLKANNLKLAYSKLKKNNYFLNLKRNSIIFPIWDDHDYGVNDGGKDWPFKDISQKLFLDFFNANKNDVRRKRGGIYNSWSIKNNIDIKVIALDTRYFKDNFKINYNKNIKKKYIPDYNTKKTILGKEQWDWFEKQIKENYDLLIILSSIQLIPKDHGWEKWYNFPHEREKILKLISDNKKLTIILSGDRHIGGMYKYNANLFEVTSSSFNQRILNFIEEDKYSIGEIVNENNFGLMNINTLERLIEIDLRTGFLKENKIFKKLKLQF